MGYRGEDELSITPENYEGGAWPILIPLPRIPLAILSCNFFLCYFSRAEKRGERRECSGAARLCLH